jgi:hypothetical protein
VPVSSTRYKLNPSAAIAEEEKKANVQLKILFTKKTEFT